ncbi:MAG: type II toxin-antitoxin system Phd/YefM family antitoxin [Bacteroidota bacterium]
MYFINDLTLSTMRAANFTEFRTNLKGFLDDVEKNNETLIIKRGTGHGAVLISLNEFNSIIETMHLLSSKANADRLYESISQMKTGKSFQKEFIEE